MNRLAWILVPAIVLAAAAMRRLGDLGDTVGSAAFLGLMACSVGLLVVVAPRDRTESAPTDRGGLLWVALGLVWIIAVPTHSALTVFVLGACWIACRAVSWRRLAGAFEFALFAILVVVAATWFVDSISLLRFASDYGAASVAGTLRLLGVEAHQTGAEVFLNGPRQVQGFLVTANNVGLAPHLAVAGTMIAWQVFGQSRALGHWWTGLGYLPTAILLRMVFFGAAGILLDHTVDYLSLDFDLSAVLDWRLGLAIDLLAGIAAGGLWFRSTPRGSTSTTPTSVVATADGSPHRVWLNGWPRYALAAIVGLLWSSDRIFDSMGQPGDGAPVRIAMDELHSHWESSDIHLTRDHYGQESGYNMRGLSNWLEGGFGPVRRVYDPMSIDSLADVDVLIVKTPTMAFAPDELAAIDHFVRNGGGLVLIGDHTNVYGTSEVLNEICTPLGFHFAYDCCFDQRSRFEFRYEPEQHVAGHPTLAGLDGILFEVGCTIEIDSPRVRPILVGRSLKSQPIDYGIENYYGAPRDRSEQECGQFPVLVVANHGAGRVAAISDSTLFSTFSVFMPGRREIVEGMVAYVSGRDVGAGFRDLIWRISIGLTLALFLLFLPGAGITAVITCGLVAWGAGNLTMVGAERWIYSGHPDLRAANASLDVKFVRSDEFVEWPTQGFSEEPDRCFSLFFQFCSRVGVFPRLVPGIEEAVASDGPIVWVDPAPKDVAGAQERLLDFVRGGGAAILVEREPRALVSSVAEAIGVDLLPSKPFQAGAALVSKFGNASHADEVPPSRGIVGGQPVLRVAGSEGVCVAAVHQVGEGRIAIVTCGGLFRDSKYGFRYGTIPDAVLRRRYEVQYDLIRATVGANER